MRASPLPISSSSPSPLAVMDNAGRATQQAWDETVGRLMSLSTATVTRNAELESRVAALEQELAAFKCTHPNGAYNARTHDPTSFIHCLIDGDANVFDQSFFRAGERGGYAAGQILAKGVADYLEALSNLAVVSRISFWTTIFMNKRGLHDTMVGRKACSSEEFEDFFYGFSQSSPRFLVVDVGQGLQGADAKIKEWLGTYLRQPQTMRIFLAASDIGEYYPALAQLDAQQLLDPLVLLEGADGAPSTLRGLRLPSLRIRGLFMHRDPLPLTPQSSPEIGPIGVERMERMSSMGSPLSPVSPIVSAGAPSCSSSQSSLWGMPRLIDPSKPLHRQEPPPCNEYYLMSCNKGSSCKYSHDYLLDAEQLEVLALSAKKAPCHFLKKGLPCGNGADCCWGHQCPHGTKCFHHSKRKCWFKGDGMHNHVPVDDV